MKLFNFIFAAILTTTAANAVVVSNIEVSGTKRMDAESVRVLLPFKKGSDVKSGDIDAAAKRLNNTGLFSFVDVVLRGSTVVVQLHENPIVGQITIEGNDNLATEDLKKEIKLAARDPYSESAVGADMQRLLTVYQRHGYFETKITPKKILRDNDRVDVVFEITEGSPCYIRKISITGNKKFGKSAVKAAMMSREAHWWRIMSDFDTFDEDRIAYDQQQLRQFYIKHGFADMKIISATGTFSTDRRGYYLSIVIEEGARYDFGVIDIKNPFRDVETDDLQDAIAFDSGDTYNTDLVDKTIAKMREIVAKRGYAFANIEPKPTKNDDARTIDLVFDLQESPRMFVNEIHLLGNTRTFDYVIERELKMQDKDPFSMQSADFSRQRLMRTGFFKNVEIKPTRLDGTNLVNLDVKVEEQPTGELSGGVGWSTINGMMIEGGITERNFMGRGQIVSLRAMTSEYQTQYSFGFTEPYLFGRALSGGFDLSYTTYDYGALGSYGYDRDTKSIGFRLGWGLTDHWSQSTRYQIVYDRINDSRMGKYYADLYSLSTTLRYYNIETDYTKNTHSGLTGSLSFNYTGFGGTENYMRYDTGLTALANFFDNRWQFKADINGGYIQPLSDNDYVSRTYRYFLGGESLRGFEVAGVGARDWYYSNYAFGGLWKVNGSFQQNFPVFIPDEYQFKGFVFYDWGVLGEPPARDMNGLFPGDKVLYSDMIRTSWGVGVNWRTPMGPMNFSWGFPIRKEKYDDEQLFLLSFETSF